MESKTKKGSGEQLEKKVKAMISVINHAFKTSWN